MIRLPKALAAWGGRDFAAVLKHELETLPPGALPLHGGLAQSTYVLENRGIGAMVIDAHADARRVRAKVGIFFSGILGGCACADDPTPVNESSEYCVLQIDIDRASAQATATLIDA